MEIEKLDIAGAVASGIGSLNLLLGRNGAGKSRFLRKLDQGLSKDEQFNVRYVSPERAGVFKRNGSVITNMENSDSWLREVRRKNQAENFKAASAQLLRDVETAYLRRLQDTPEIRLDPSKNFYTDRLERVNRLLPNIRIEQEKSDFVFKTLTGELVLPDQISSGESESVSLATEIMFFFETLDNSKFNVLLLDEPDVHLHPDLQARLIHFLIQQIEELSEAERSHVTVLIATHSTPLISAAATSDFVKIGTKNFDDDFVEFRQLDENVKKVAPFFGHPLSLSLSNDIMLILEGEDDERVWQQASRSSNSKINVFPVLAQSVDAQGDMEQFCEKLLSAIYDNPVAYSIRDGDGVTEDLNPVGSVVRFRLQCYAIENALATDECLALIGLTWGKFQQRAENWIQKNDKHRDVDLIKMLISSDDRLRHQKIKKIRQLICSIAGSNKPWEVVLGQSIAALSAQTIINSGPHLSAYLGNALVKTIIISPSHIGAEISN
ncbi:AAA family ATPase [Synechocystis sp. FACHB-383]|uniref:AAA family ATPase n=1 Tax=Synechocystis sp. FACHB-383 TaxID=2692864 RepID=UPI0016833A20|nr:AAA family ATPase [Synechocystis sp. FACHB-383]MBD2655435.1 AAA family ATPase [Synechocystis sp. FACHB-383]